MIKNFAALVATIGACAPAFAQQFELEAVSGCTLEGTTFRLTQETFTVRAFLNMQGSTDRLAAIYLGLAFTSDLESSRALTFLGGQNRPFMDNFSNVLTGATFTERYASIFNPGNYISNPQGSGPTRVIYHGRNRQDHIEVPQRFEFADFTFRSNLPIGTIFGDDVNETGLFAAKQSGTGINNNGASGISAITFGGQYSSRKIGSPKYIIVAPEPTSIAGLGLALAYLARRKKVRA